jgi:hypothetical protein
MAVCGGYGALSAAFCWRLFVVPNGLGIMDWDEKHFYYGSVLKNAIEYGQLPFWNPWQCGGNVLWQNPEVELLTPAYPLSLFMSLALAIKITIVLHYLVAFIGMHLLLTDILGLSFLPLVVYLASLFTLSGAPAMHVAVGHSVLLPMFYLPLQVYFVLRAFRSGMVGDALAAAVLLALMIVNGGLHIVAMGVVAIGMLTLAAVAARRSLAPLALAAIIGAAGLAYAAPKLVPVVEFVTSDRFTDNRGAFVHPDYMSLGMIERAYLELPDDRRDPEQVHGWYEYGDYLGSLAPFLIIASLVWILSNWRARDSGWLGLSLALTMLLMFAWSAGEFAWFAPAMLAQHLPFFSRFRVPSRYAIAVGLFAAGTVGWTIRELTHGIPRGARLFVGAVCVLATLQLMQNGGNFEGAFGEAPVDRGFQFMRGPRTFAVDSTTSPFAPHSPMVHALMNSVAFENCYEPFQLQRTEAPDLPLVFASGDAKIVDVGFTPNRVDFSVIGGREPSRVVLNQNFGPGWRSNAGPVTADERGRMSVALAPGQTGRFAFTYRPPGLWPGLAIFLAAAAVTPAVWRRRIG